MVRPRRQSFFEAQEKIKRCIKFDKSQSSSIASRVQKRRSSIKTRATIQIKEEVISQRVKPVNRDSDAEDANSNASSSEFFQAEKPRQYPLKRLNSAKLSTLKSPAPQKTRRYSVLSDNDFESVSAPKPVVTRRVTIVLQPLESDETLRLTQTPSQEQQKGQQDNVSTDDDFESAIEQPSNVPASYAPQRIITRRLTIPLQRLDSDEIIRLSQNPSKEMQKEQRNRVLTNNDFETESESTANGVPEPKSQGQIVTRSQAMHQEKETTPVELIRKRSGHVHHTSRDETSSPPKPSKIMTRRQTMIEKDRLSQQLLSTTPKKKRRNSVSSNESAIETTPRRVITRRQSALQGQANERNKTLVPSRLELDNSRHEPNREFQEPVVPQTTSQRVKGWVNQNHFHCDTESVQSTPQRLSSIGREVNDRFQPTQSQVQPTQHSWQFDRSLTASQSLDISDGYVSMLSDDINNNRSGQTFPIYSNVKQSDKIPTTQFTINSFNQRQTRKTRVFLSRFTSKIPHLNNSFRLDLYASRTTGHLVCEHYKVKKELIRVLAPGKSIKVDGVEVTAIDVPYYPGALLFVFKLKTGKSILHAGDLRVCAELEEYMTNYTNRIDEIYFDKTVLERNFYGFSSDIDRYIVLMKECGDFFEENRSRLKGMIMFGVFELGMEFLIERVARLLGLHVWMDAKQQSFLEKIKKDDENSIVHGLLNRVTRDKEKAQIHITPVENINHNFLSKYLGQTKTFYRMLAIRPCGNSLVSSKVFEYMNLQIIDTPNPLTSNVSEYYRFVKVLSSQQ